MPMRLKKNALHSQSQASPTTTSNKDGSGKKQNKAALSPNAKHDNINVASKALTGETANEEKSSLLEQKIVSPQLSDYNWPNTTMIQSDSRHPTESLNARGSRLKQLVLANAHLPGFFKQIIP